MKKVIFGVVFIFAGFLLGACGSTVSAEQNYPLKIWKQNRNGQMETWEVIDEDTGVSYIVVGARYSTGHEYGGISITPRLNADGSLYITR